MKLFAQNEYLFRIRIWIYKRFSGNESFKFDKIHIGRMALRFSINSINVQFRFGFDADADADAAAVDPVLLCTKFVCVMRNTNAIRNMYIYSTQMNKKQPKLQRFIRLSIVLSKCETTAHKIQTQFALFSMRPYLLSVIVFILRSIPTIFFFTWLKAQIRFIFVMI